MEMRRTPCASYATEASLDVPIMSVCLHLSMVPSLHFTYAEFDVGRPHRLLAAALGVSVVVASLACGPSKSTTVLGPISVAFVTTSVAFQVVVMG
jgi:hypothetical protein